MEAEGSVACSWAQRRSTRKSLRPFALLPSVPLPHAASDDSLSGGPPSDSLGLCEDMRPCHPEASGAEEARGGGRRICRFYLVTTRLAEKE